MLLLLLSALVKHKLLNSNPLTAVFKYKTYN